ncbi:hypothetical protein CHH53_08825 [Terribacillus sp. 7520-G]|nr:hypothetical protein CHH53_08825 [Terribacillus sp. 7520-G]
MVLWTGAMLVCLKLMRFLEDIITLSDMFSNEVGKYRRGNSHKNIETWRMAGEVGKVKPI